MIDGIPVAAFANGFGVVTVVLIVGWMVATGRLVTRREHEDVKAARDIKDKQIAEKDKQLAEFSKLGTAVHAVMRAIQKGPPT